jgi:anti-sigma factor RsiW
MMRTWIRRRRDELRCKEVARVLQAHVDGELDPEAARKASSHLDACLRCGMEASAYQDLKAQLAKLAEPVDAGAVARLRAFADELTAQETD